jgi:hypothetical protein
VLGAPLHRPAGYLPRVGALIERPAFYPALSGAQNLRVLATVADSWCTGFRVFPGQVLASLIQGGRAELGAGRAAVTAVAYGAVAAAVALVVVARRDVTA